MPRTFTEEEVEQLIEQAYLNGIAEAGMARIRCLPMCESKDFKSSTTYYKFNAMKKNS